MSTEVSAAPESTDTRALTMRRFGRVSATGGSGARKVPLDQLPPGPRWPVLLQTVALMRFRHQFHPWLRKRYGDTFSVNLVPGNRPLVLFTRPEDTKQIFAGDPAVFHAGKGNAILAPVMGDHSLLLTDGADHHRARKLLMPAFLGHALRSYRGMVADLAAEEVAQWREGETFTALGRMNALTLEVILRVVFGVSDETRLAQLRPRVVRTVEINPAILLGWAYPRLQKLGPWRRTVENQVELDRLIYAEIRERRQVADLDQRADVLSRLLIASNEAEASGEQGLDDTELRDHLVTLLLAGHETTASALSWALVEIGRSPDLLARTQRAVATGDDAWLEAVLKESMRLHPIIPMVVRTLLEPTRVGDWDLPAGATVGPSIVISHQDAANFPEPEMFRPERFLVDPAPALNVWIPFGGGVRRCIGAGFSVMEGVEVLRAVFGRYDVTAVGSDVPKVRNITSVPRRGARIRVQRRD
ncbi:MAG: cytochrome P450 [Nocardioidaceae bacterium]|nr:cytochrome P450 [Nocardioidaceae bacterium]